MERIGTKIVILNLCFLSVYLHLMTNRIESNPYLSPAQLEKIRSLCAQYRVAALYLFGSALTDHFRADSDVDFLVRFREMALLEYADNYFDFLDELRKVVKREVDLVIEKDLSNPVLIEEINANKVLVYEHSEVRSRIAPSARIARPHRQKLKP